MRGGIDARLVQPRSQHESLVISFVSQVYLRDRAAKMTPRFQNSLSVLDS